jgi:hypothetical protein
VSGDVRIEAKATDDGDLVCDPYPFADDPAEFAVEAYRTERKTWESLAGFRHAFRTADPRVVTFRCVPG